MLDTLRMPPATVPPLQTLAATLELLSDAVVCCDAEGVITLLNRPAARLLGCPTASAIGQSLHAFLPTDAGGLLACSDASERTVEIRGSTKGSTTGPTHAVATVALLAAADDLYCSIRLRPLRPTAQGQQDSTLPAAIIGPSDDIIIGKTLDGIVTAWNAGAQRLFGYSAEEMIDQPVSRLIPKDRESEEPRIQECLRAGERVDHFDTIRVTKAGKRVDVSLTISPVLDCHGDIVGASKVVRDITERTRRREDRGRAVSGDHRRPGPLLGVVVDVPDRKAADEAERRRDDDLAHLSRVSTMGQMASGLAHELNQPLGAILNYAGVCENLARQSTDPRAATLRSAISEVLNETRRAGAIIGRLRAFMTKQFVPTAPVAVNELVRESLALLGFELRDHGVSVHCDFQPGLPDVFVDAIQIEQVIVNLLSNAKQAMDAVPLAKRSLMVTTAAAAAGWVTVTIADQGPAVTAEQFDGLFVPFRSTKPQGMGIGLQISRAIIESHGGRLDALCVPAGGMSFSFTLPTRPGVLCRPPNL